MKAFSKQSRLRLLTFMNQVDWQRIPLVTFVTLTYPDSVVHRDYKIRSRDRFLFLRSLEKHLGKQVGCIWRVEWKPRKSGKFVGRLMPHWHLLLADACNVSNRVVNPLWASAIGNKGKYVNTDCRVIEGVEGAIKYVAKYCSKQLTLGITAYRNSGFNFGRHWGICRKPLFPLCPAVLKRELNAEEVEAVRYYGNSIWAWYDEKTGKGYTLLGQGTRVWWQDFLDVVLTGQPKPV